MMKRYLLPATPLAAMLLLTGCMDDNYDLSNINTTTEVKVNGLTIPVNLNEVKLDALIDLGEDSDIKEETDPVTGKKIYVYMYPNDNTVDNTFSSDEIEINAFDVKSNPIDQTTITVQLDNSAAAPVKKAPAGAITYKVKEDIVTDFTFDVQDIDESVTKISKLGTPAEAGKRLNFDVTLTFPQAIVQDCKSIMVKELKIKFPDGLNGHSTLGTYANDVVTLQDVEIVNGKLTFEVYSSEVDINQDFHGIAGPRDFTYAETIVVKQGGSLLLTLKDNVTPADEFTITNDYYMPDFKVTQFSGGIDYKIDGLEIDPISLADMPDFLTEPGTNLKLANPQLYLALNNPVSKYDLEPTTQMAFIQVRNGVAMDNDPMTLPGGLTIYANQPENYVYHYALSPEGQSLEIPNTPDLSGFSNASTIKLPYPELSNVLAGDGMPEKLNVEFSDTKILNDDVKNFDLGVKIKGVDGHYIFRAPLALAAGSEIYKSGTETDWSSEDLDRLYVKEVVLNTTVTSTVPMGVQLEAQIRNVKGEHVGKSNKVMISALAENEPITLVITATNGEEINDIDGIYYEAVCIVEEGEAAGQTLSPDQTIVLSDVRAKVTGRYLYEDDGK